MELDSKSPSGPIETRWEKHRFNLKLVNPANKRKYTIIVVGTGLAGGSAAASLSCSSWLFGRTSDSSTIAWSRKYEARYCRSADWC